MKFAKEGTALVAVAGVAALASGPLFGEVAMAGGLVGTLAVLLFFRDPDRVVPRDEGAVVSPADGRVVVASAGASPHRLDPGATVKVAIFMSPLDVHVNRSPVDALLEKVEHRPGRFAAAYREDAGDINESNSMLLRTSSGAGIVVVQIAGWLARRIVCRVRPGVRLSRGERFGLIMFGSRVDVHMPPGTRLAVAPGQTVRAGETVLAWLDAGGADQAEGRRSEA